MDISLKWVQDFVELPKGVSPAELADKLTLHSFELEGVKELGAGLDNIMLAEVTAVDAHPNADKLKVCTVNDGKTDRTIVCGGTNVVAGMKVALGIAGAKVLWHGEGDLVELKDIEIRGVKSEGMICAAEEIGLATGHETEGEIMDLSAVEAKLGTPLKKALELDDNVLDVDNKGITNRPDAWGHYGVAREIAALYDKTLKPYPQKKFDSSKDVKLKVVVKSKTCRRYRGVVIEGVKIGPSPQWMQARLRAAGVRSISNIVDVTNYVMLELGQPLHAFDLNNLASPEIIVRDAVAGEKFVLLGGEEVELDPSMCVIADTNGVIALAGVKGGEHSGINEQTTTIVLESANFEPLAVRKAGQKVGLRTDASARFEKNLDPVNAELAMTRCVNLIQEMLPEAKVVSAVADQGNWKKAIAVKPIVLDLDFLYSKLGITIPATKVGTILKRLGFAVSKTKKKNQLKVEVPSWRATGDISEPEDLVEEVGRIYGYAQIEPSSPIMAITPPQDNPERTAVNDGKQQLVDRFGFNETQSYSFVSEKTLHALDQDLSEYIAIANPLSSEQGFVRRSLIPNLLYQVSANMRRVDQVALCEVAKVFLQEREGDLARPDEDRRLAYQPYHAAGVVSEKGNETPFMRAKAAALGMLDALGVAYRTEPGEHFTNWMHPGRSLTIYVNDERVGDVSELHPAYMDEFDLEHRVGFFEIDLTTVAEHLGSTIEYTPLPKFPAVKRDLAFVVPEHSRYDYIVEALQTADPLITEVELFDVYRGKGVEVNHKSMAFHLHFSDPERTLTAQEVDAVFKKLVKLLEEKFKISVRS